MILMFIGWVNHDPALDQKPQTQVTKVVAPLKPAAPKRHFVPAVSMTEADRGCTEDLGYMGHYPPTGNEWDYTGALARYLALHQICTEGRTKPHWVDDN
jgi:hypothetical protein